MLKNILSVILFFIMIFPVYAEESEVSFGGAAGIKSIVSADNLGGRYYLKPFASAKASFSIVDVSADYYLWKGYTITDALFNEKQINIHQAGAAASLYPADAVNFSGEYYYLTGHSSYKGHKFGGEAELCFDGFSITAGYSGKSSSYQYNGTVKSIIHTATLSPEFEITDVFSVDAAYDVTYSDYESYGYSVIQHSVRLGCTEIYSKNLFLIGGLSAGYDSNSLFSAGADAAVVWKLFDHIKLNAAYAINADIISSSTDTAGTAQKNILLTAGPGGGSQAASEDSNFSINAEYSHSFIIGASLYF